MQKFFGSFFQKRTRKEALLFEKRSKNFYLLGHRLRPAAVPANLVTLT
jgi:hypothetical protein